MQKAQDLHIKHLYALGEDQQDSSTISSPDALPEIMVNEVNACENRGWYKSNNDFSEHSQNLREVPRQTGNYTQQKNFSQPFNARATPNSEDREPSQNSWVTTQNLTEAESLKDAQQPSMIHGSFTQIMVNPMQLQDHTFMAWLDRLVEARKNRQEKRQHPYRTYCKPYNEQRQQGERWNRLQLRNRIKPAQELEVQQIMENL